MDNMPLLIDLIKSKQQYKPMEHERANSVEYNCSSQKPTQALQRKTKVPKANNYKTSVHEVIDLESDAAPASKGSMQDSFVKFTLYKISNLGKQCAQFFQWSQNTDSILLPEMLWKSQKLAVAARMCPELNCYELERLVDRDWRIMSKADAHRAVIVNRYTKQPDIAQLALQIEEQNQLLLCLQK